MDRLKLWISKIIKIILLSICFCLAVIALSLGQHPNLSPLPALIGICSFYAIDRLISYILIKTKHENSPYFDPKQGWKYMIPLFLIIFITVIAVYLYQFLKRG